MRRRELSAISSQVITGPTCGTELPNWPDYAAQPSMRRQPTPDIDSDARCSLGGHDRAILSPNLGEELAIGTVSSPNREPERIESGPKGTLTDSFHYKTCLETLAEERSVD